MLKGIQAMPDALKNAGNALRPPVASGGDQKENALVGWLDAIQTAFQKTSDNSETSVEKNSSEELSSSCNEPSDFFAAFGLQTELSAPPEEQGSDASTDIAGTSRRAESAQADPKPESGGQIPGSSASFTLPGVSASARVLARSEGQAEPAVDVIQRLLPDGLSTGVPATGTALSRQTASQRVDASDGLARAVIVPATGAAQITSLAVAATNAAPDAAQTGGAAALPGTGMKALTDVLQASVTGGDVQSFSVAGVAADKAALRGIQEAASGATRRKLNEALRGAFTETAQASLSSASTPVDARGSVSGDAGPGLLPVATASDALIDRPVPTLAEGAALLQGLDVRSGNAEISAPAASAEAAGIPDLDWIAILDEQAGLARLRDTDSLRVDLRLADDQRLALEARMLDGVLTVRMGARADGSAWVPAEQMEAVKAALMGASAEVRSVVFENAADLSQGDSGQAFQQTMEGSDRGADRGAGADSGRSTGTGQDRPDGRDNGGGPAERTRQKTGLTENIGSVGSEIGRPGGDGPAEGRVSLRA